MRAVSAHDREEGEVALAPGPAPEAVAASSEAPSGSASPVDLSVEDDDGRTRFLTPAAATLFFLVARFFFGLTEGPEASMAGLAGEGVNPSHTVRVVAEIPSAKQTRVEERPVPATERALLELFRRDGEVHFGPAEVEPLRTPTREFTLEEVGVILVPRAL